MVAPSTYCTIRTYVQGDPKVDIAILAARMLLAAVFAVAGVAKLADLAGSRQAMRDFGVPKRLATPLGTFLPLVEIAVAVTLLPRATAWLGAVGALALLVAFVAGIGTSLARGKQPDCHCFGQLHSAPAGWATLARNGLLAAVALFILLQGRNNPGSSVVDWADELSTIEGIALGVGVIALTLLAAEGWVLIQLLGQNGRLLVRLDALEAAQGGVLPTGAAARATSGLPIGTPAPALSLPGLHGEIMTLEALRSAGKPVVLIFSDPNCGPCNALLPEIGRWQREHAAMMTVALVTRGTAEGNRAKSTEHGLTQVLIQTDREVAEAYRAHGTPTAVLVRPDGTVGSPLAPGAEAIRSLVMRTAEAPDSAPTIPLRPVPGYDGVRNGTNGNPGRASVPAPPAATKIGEAAPALRLPDLDGNEVDLASFKGRSTLVLFWNPGCGFCARMLDDLKAWEAAPPPDAPRLLVVSTGRVEVNREMDLSATVLLDQGFAAGREFGASGTPSAVLIDADGKIASHVAVGAPSVLALAGAAREEVESENA